MLAPKSFVYNMYSCQQRPLSFRISSPNLTKPESPVPLPLPLRQKDDRPPTNPHNNTASAKPFSTTADTSETMSRRRESGPLSALTRSLPNATMMNVAAPRDAPASAVQIPRKQNAGASRHHKPRHHKQHADAHRRRSSASPWPREQHDPEAVPASVAALLAITNIPPPRRRASLRQRRLNGSPMTFDSIVPPSQVTEKELSDELGDGLSVSSMSRSPLDILLTPPEYLLDDDEDASLNSDSLVASTPSTREGSFDSLPSLLPSLGDSLANSTPPSTNSPVTPRGRKYRRPTRSLEPLSSPPGKEPEHPLYVDPSADADQVPFKAFDPLATATEKRQSTVFMPLKTAFKSNLTASLRALRSAAKSLSAFTASSIPPEDLLTRSILTADPVVPFTDERRPPVLAEEPSEAMRRYLNPTSNARLDLRTGNLPGTRSYTASIQMQTYKVQKSRGASPATSRNAAPQAPGPPKASTDVVIVPGPRQREIRENSDFIRIAVMEHMMRKRGKLDDSREGHARWLLPPRKPSSKPYEIGADGVPARWLGISQDMT